MYKTSIPKIIWTYTVLILFCFFFGCMTFSFGLFKTLHPHSFLEVLRVVWNFFCHSMHFVPTILDKTVSRENCILRENFSKHRNFTSSSLSPFPWKQCYVFKRKPDPWAFVGSNIELREGDFFPQRCHFGNSIVA